MLAELKKIHPISDVNQLFAMENNELHDTLMACRILYAGRSGDLKFDHRSENGKHSFNRFEAVQEVLRLRAAHAAKTSYQRLAEVVED